MHIKAEKYYDDNLENYNLLNKIDPMTAKQVMEMMEGYHQAKLKLLGIGGVSQHREQLPCEHDYQPDITCGVDITCCTKCGDVI